ncbi:MAG: UvrD-helicase domain-containing protein, partial [Blautia sp.]|nr:UvrD-helicase domain-containing protein [Blautia sp.]
MAKVVRNPAQQEAIAHLSGPMMVLAGPGSGKTSVIVERCAQMIAAGISPGNILVVTFSRMAAGEMKERFLRFIGEESTLVTFGTFHGVFYAILKHAYGYTPANILSEEEKRKLIRQVLIECGQEQMLEGDFLEDILGEISLVKNGRLELAYYHS